MTTLVLATFGTFSTPEVKDGTVNPMDVFQRVTASNHRLTESSQPLTLHDTTLLGQMVYGHKHADGG